MEGIEGLDKRQSKIEAFARSFNKCNNPEQFCNKRIDIVARPKVNGLITVGIANNDIVDLVAEYPETVSVLNGFDMSFSSSNVSISSESSNYDSKSDVNSLIAQGKSAREINQLYPEYPIMKLAGMKAAYRRKENARDLGIDGSLDINIMSESNKSIESNQDLSKEEAIFLIKSGFTTEDIANTFSAYDKNQLKAFKAHNTMGRY
jgi:translation initiation factor 2 beta subunit (eIF-2beta)/eIF-5